jgi:PAS domain S-box-containing protein
MIAVSNREGGYSRNELEMLEALAPVIVEVFLRKRAQLALNESERRLRRAEEMAHLGHWSLDARTNRMFWSDELCRIWGMTGEGASGPAFDELSVFVHPDDLERRNSWLETIRRDGRAEVEYRIIRPDGELRNLTCYGERVNDEADDVAALFGAMLDTTDIRQKERELQEKNAELERFTYMISHDLKSPVVTIKTFLGYLEQDLARSNAERIGKDMHYIHAAADKMGRLLEELLEMSRVGHVVNSMEQVTFRELVEEALGMVAGSIAERRVALLVADEAVTLHGDRPRLVEVWQNLVENAVKFMGDQPSPHIEIGVEPHGRDTLFFVRDNGVGIDMRYNKKIFDLFEKLDARAEGTGLGLALVKRIVELYGGSIRVESAGHGLGSCFLFTLPAAVQATMKGGT